MVIRCLFLKFGLLGLGIAVFLPGLSGQSKFEDTRATLLKWIETEGEIARANNEWTEEKETLDDILSVLESEKGMLQEALDNSEEEISQADAKRAKLGAKRDGLKEASGVISQVIGGLEKKLHELHPYFPEPLQNTIAPLYTRVPEAGEDTNASLSARMQNVVGILTQVDKFNGGITLHSSPKKLDSGKTVQIKTLYLGLGCAFFIDKVGSYAGLGVPGPDGWDWKERADLAPVIAEVIDVYEDPQKASFVQLPISVK